MMRTRWYRHFRGEVPPLLPEDGGPVEPEVEPEPGPFDHPHRIRDRDLLAQQADAPLPEAAALRMGEHRAQTEALRASSPPPVSVFEGIEVAEANDPSMQEMVRLHTQGTEHRAALEQWLSVRDSRAVQVALKALDLRDRAKQKIGALRSR